MPGMLSDESPISARTSTTCAGGTPKNSFTPASSRSISFTGCQTATSGSPRRAGRGPCRPTRSPTRKPGLLRRRRDRPDQVVGLEPRLLDDREAHRPAEPLRVVDLRNEVVRHGRALRLVARVHLVRNVFSYRSKRRDAVGLPRSARSFRSIVQRSRRPRSSAARPAPSGRGSRKRRGRDSSRRRRARGGPFRRSSPSRRVYPAPPAQAGPNSSTSTSASGEFRTGETDAEAHRPARRVWIVRKRDSASLRREARGAVASIEGGLAPASSRNRYAARAAISASNAATLPSPRRRSRDRRPRGA